VIKLAKRIFSLGIVLFVLLANTALAAEPTHIFDIPRQSAFDSLPLFGEQAGVSVVYDYEQIRDHETNPLSGKYGVAHAIEILLENTGLIAAFDSARHLIVSRDNNYRNSAMNTNKNVLTAALGFLAGLGTGQQAEAQEVVNIEPESHPFVLEEVIVRARRIEENLQDVPISVTAFSGADIENMQIRTTDDLMFNVPSLNVTRVAGGNGPNYGIRGQNTGIGNARAVITYFAEVPVVDNVTYQQTYDMASIEVLKGPQGTLFGANSNGGVILFNPKKPTDELEGELTLSLGNYDAQEASGVINVPVHEKVQIRGAAKYVRRDGYTDNLNPCPLNMFTFDCGRKGDLDDEKYESYRLSVSIQPLDWLENDFVYFQTKDHRYGPSWIPFRYGTDPVINPLNDLLFNDQSPLWAPAGMPTTVDQALEFQEQVGIRNVYADETTLRNKIWGISNITVAEVSGVTIKNILGYQDVKLRFSRDQDGSILPLVWQDFGENPREILTEEIQLLGAAFDDRLSYVVGAYFSRNEAPGGFTYAWLSYPQTEEQVAGFTSVGFGALADPLVGPDTKADTKDEVDAYFANVSVDLSDWVDGLSFSGGYRYTENNSDRKLFYQRVNGECLAVPPAGSALDEDACAVTTKLKTDGDNYSATAEYAFSDDVMAYFATRHGFKPGGINPTAEESTYSQYDPEEITDYEIGLKSQFQLRDVFVRANIAAYTSDYKDSQRSEVIPQPSGDPAVITFNAQKATIDGVEAEIDFILTPNLRVGMFYSYIDASFDEYVVPDVGGGTIDKSGTTFSGVSKDTFGANMVYDLPLDEAYGEVTLAANYYYRSSQTFAGDPLGQPTDIFVPSYETTNVQAYWLIPNTRIKISALVSNVFDKDYVVAGEDYTQSFVGYAIEAYGPPRLYRMELNYQF
jgi:iron complex outermembrane recepter protein